MINYHIIHNDNIKIDWLTKGQIGGWTPMETIEEEFIKVINGVDVNKLQATIDAINKDPDLASFTFRTVTEWVDGARNKTLVERQTAKGEKGEPFVLVSDEPELLMGGGTAPNSIALVLQALASCLSVSMVYHAAAREMQIDKLTISIDGDIDLHGFLGLSSEVRPGFQDIRVEVDVHSPAPREEIEELLRYAQKVSPVVDSLRNRIPVEISLR